VIDEILEPFHQQHYWGYSLPNYLSAKYNTHPNYAGYLADKNTLTVHDMDEIFEIMDDSKRNEFDKKYAEEIYLKYLSTGNVKEQHLSELKKLLEGKKILIVAPGKSSTAEKEKIIGFMRQSNVLTFSINYDYPYAESDFIFLSNLRRFKELNSDKKSKCIVTSNIPADNVYLQTKYSDLLNNHEMVQDNAGMMSIRFLSNLGATEFYLAGIDGYSHDVNENYGNDHMTFVARNAVLDEMNKGMQEVLKEYSTNLDIHFLTAPKYITI
jgi:4-hydroxy 2-oxovalerate aldolase